MNNPIFEDGARKKRHHEFMGKTIPVYPLLSAREMGERLERAEAALQQAQDSIARLSSWQPMTTAPKDGSEIIVLLKDQSRAHHPYFVSSAVWRDADEGVQEGWWDDTCISYWEPLGWLPHPPTSNTTDSSRG